MELQKRKWLILPSCLEWPYGFRTLGRINYVATTDCHVVTEHFQWDRTYSQLCTEVKERRRSRQNLNKGDNLPPSPILLSSLLPRCPTLDFHSIRNGQGQAVRSSIAFPVEWSGFCHATVASIVKCLEIIELVHDQWLKICS